MQEKENRQGLAEQAGPTETVVGENLDALVLEVAPEFKPTPQDRMPVLEEDGTTSYLTIGQWLCRFPPQRGGT